MISLDIRHIYGAVFIDLAKVTDIVDHTFLLQQFKRDRDFILACFSSNIIGHWILWGSWHCKSSAVSYEERTFYPPQTAGLASFLSTAYSLATTSMIHLKSLQ